jgi:hypothetical protein
MTAYLSKIERLEKQYREKKREYEGISRKPIPDKWEDFCRLTYIRSGNKIVKFDPYEHQIKLSECIDKYYGTVAVKTRQLGITQAVVSKFLHKACKNPAYTALILSKNQDDTRKIAARIGEMITCLVPEYLTLENDSKLHLKIKNGGQIYFRNSSPDGARGIDSVSDVLLDEAAFVEAIELIYTAVLPTTEMVGDDARIVVLSTPNGRGEWFFEQLSSNNDKVDVLEVCEQIKRKEINPTQWWVDTSGWCKFITHWLAHPLYSSKPNYLEDIQQKKKLSPAKVEQEYNLGFTDDEVSVFSAAIIQACAIGNYELTRDDNSDYYIGIDVSFGGDDYTVAVVLKRSVDKIEVVSLYRKRRETSDYNIYHISELIKKWEPKAIGVEVNGGGKIYAEQLYKLHPDIEIVEVRTTEQSKPVMIERLKLTLEQEKFLFPNKCAIRDEFLTFRRQGKKMQAVNGKYDDCIMGSAIALATITECEATNVFGSISIFRYEA